MVRADSIAPKRSSDSQARSAHKTRPVSLFGSLLEQVIGRGGLKIRIDVGSGTRVSNGVIGECLVNIRSIATPFAPRQGVHKILNFSDPIQRKSLDFFDEFLLFPWWKV
jgi:hypothetical protein